MSLPCRRCHRAMNGITDFAARDTCTPCGGKGKFDNRQKAEDIRRRWMAEETLRQPRPGNGRAA